MLVIIYKSCRVSDTTKTNNFEKKLKKLLTNTWISDKI